MRYQIEFPDFDPATMPPIPSGWQDISWHNDAMPFFLVSPSLGVWIDFADPEQSDFATSRADGYMKRFMTEAMFDGQHGWTNEQRDNVVSKFKTDDWEQLLAFVRNCLAAEYVTTIGYDPFEDDPTISAETVAEILRQHAVEAAAAEAPTGEN